MGKVIAVWGCPGSGKTTLCIKLAKALHDKHGMKVICIFADSAAPTLPSLFPNRKVSELRSIGAALSHTEITEDAVLKSIVYTKKARNIGFMGYTDGENRYSYPELSREKAAALLDTAASLADIAIVDCGTKLTGPLAYTAICVADSIIRVCKPDMKAISFFSSQLPLYGNVRYRLEEHHTVLNVNDNEMPVQDAAQHYDCINHIIPYTKEIRQQAMNGLLFDKVSGKPFNKAIDRIIRLAVIR
jgi:MinD-like ATPase involved in chromosome partitioning or flagellar assembly